ncbi:hypothetical protein SAMN05216487_3558 [Pseudomonas sp. UC 17F4]|nr:hypothetical protein SAMN05216487_3558 [Pseudomonas sp. UC 17F4]
MRPLVRPLLPNRLRQAPAARLLLSAFGNFCSFCERPLLDDVWVWNARTGACVEGDNCSAQDWEHLYLLDHDCHQAQQQADQQELPLLMLPTESLVSYPHGANYPLSYSFQSIQRVLLDEDNSEYEREPIGAVLISTTHYRAQATVRYFALNTSYINADANELRIPGLDYLSLLDRRLDQRTDAWNFTQEAAMRINESQTQAVREAGLQQLRLLVGTVGFWSTCRTAAGTILPYEQLQQVFDPIPLGQLAITVQPLEHHAGFLGNGPHQPFPGTARI